MTAVLIVEDDARLRDAFTHAVMRAPDMTLAGSACDYATALALLKSVPDVMLVDLQLPDGDGIARQLLTRFAARTQPPVAEPMEGELPSLSEQEAKVLALTAKGYSYDEIAVLMKVSRHTVQTYVKRAYRKLQVNSKLEALFEARRLRLNKEPRRKQRGIKRNSPATHRSTFIRRKRRGIEPTVINT